MFFSVSGVFSTSDGASVSAVVTLFVLDVSAFSVTLSVLFTSSVVVLF
ncbi:MAG: hypothetical protein ACD_79C01137G0001, partial [uncultured bacterium]